jgi:hypothetical protein
LVLSTGHRYVARHRGQLLCGGVRYTHLRVDPIAAKLAS